ncbi:Plasmodium exported protein (PHISTa), unknown, putative [Plasmodium sp. gorilla clade G1]|nr:Plasmodium exported protein (PHISTa), unknown, putative [Plasmodium sp. gorilla clade G1]
MNKNNCSRFRLCVDENQKGKLHYISFKFLCLCLYMIGFYYVFLNNSSENSSLETVKNCNIYKRNLVQVEKNNKDSKVKESLKFKKEDKDISKDKVNVLKYKEQKILEYIYAINNDIENINVKNERNISISSINNNDASKNLTEKELYEFLNSLEECPSNEDLRKIWTKTLAVAKGGFDDIHKELKELIQKYLDNDIYTTFRFIKRKFGYENIWEENIFRFYRTVANEEVQYSNDFYKLINDEHTLDDVLKFIYSFLEHFKTLKKELPEEHQKQLLKKIAQKLNK